MKFACCACTRGGGGGGGERAWSGGPGVHVWVGPEKDIPRSTLATLNIDLSLTARGSSSNDATAVRTTPNEHKFR